MALTAEQRSTILRAAQALGSGSRVDAIAYINHFVDSTNPEASELLITSVNQFSSWRNLSVRQESNHVR